ncbi:hypothetical protein RhiirA4_541363 [Rhizophagus irregularis]|uniref:Sequence orphan n=2 Tax=Rhizophagus irregularis TaxID=588596 RepID=A0A2I1GAZ0_9GLOM|nr:hypothetical protein RhiirA4_541363 [Rhizophagus irregularis]
MKILSTTLFVVVLELICLVQITVPEKCLEYISPFYQKTRMIDCPMIHSKDSKDKRQTSSKSDNMITVDFQCLIDDKQLCKKVEQVFITAGKFITATLNLKSIISVNAQFLDFCKTYGKCDKDVIILGAAGPARMIPYQDPKENKIRFYPQALYKQMNFPIEHPEFGPNEIMATFNSNTSYWFEGDPLPMLEKQSDMLYVVIHEMIHGLGFTTSWDDYFGIKALTPAIGGTTKPPAPGEITSQSDELQSSQFFELISDKFLVLLPSGKLVSSIADEINKFQFKIETLSSTDGIASAFSASPQFPVAKNMYNTAMTHGAMGFLTIPPSDQLTREQILNNVIILETSLIPYQHGSSVAHTDFDTYVNSSDFLMLFTYPKTATLGQIMSAVGSTNTTGPIGPKLRLLLGSLGYEVKKEYTPPVKLSSIPIKNYNPSNTYNKNNNNYNDMNNSSFICVNIILNLVCIIIIFFNSIKSLNLSGK